MKKKNLILTFILVAALTFSGLIGHKVYQMKQIEDAKETLVNKTKKLKQTKKVATTNVKTSKEQLDQIKNQKSDVQKQAETANQQLEQSKKELADLQKQLDELSKK
jgi:peptidoglycan hydrolase CwlO-like protein